MARRKGKVNEAARPRGYPFAARWILDRRLHTSQAAAEMEVAAISISGGDFLVDTPRLPENACDHRFKTADQAHAMQVWLEAHARPYDPFDDRLYSAEQTRNAEREIDDAIAAAAATGVLLRVARATAEGGSRAGADVLVGQGLQRMEAARLQAFMIDWVIEHHADWYRSYWERVRGS